jgi:hypothetical protein
VTNPRAAILSWEQSDTTYILTESPTVDGLYTPSLEPIVFGGNQVPVLTSEPSTRFFKLAPGGQVLEDFSRGADYAWKLGYLDPAEAGMSRLSYPDGALHIEWDPGFKSAVFLSPPTWWQDDTGHWPHGVDVAMSVDLLAWDWRETICFGARFLNNPGEVDDGNGYWPRLIIPAGPDEDAELSNLKRTNPGAFEAIGMKKFQLGTKRPLRLVYAVAGSVHTLAVFELANPATPIASVTSRDDSYREGLFTLTCWPWEGMANPPNLTIDNVVMTWTSP